MAGLTAVIADTIRERRTNAVTLAGVAWLAVATLGLLSAATLPLFGLGLLFVLPLVGVPLMFVSGLWGWRSAVVGWFAAAYSLLPALGVVASGIYNSYPTAFVIALLVAIPGILSVLAATQLRREGQERSAQARSVPPG